MRVGELIDYLENYDEDMEIVMQPSNSMYVDDICDISVMELRSFWGNDREVCVITSDGQAGAV